MCVCILHKTKKQSNYSIMNEDQKEERYSINNVRRATETPIGQEIINTLNNSIRGRELVIWMKEQYCLKEISHISLFDKCILDAVLMTYLLKMCDDPRHFISDCIKSIFIHHIGVPIANSIGKYNPVGYQQVSCILYLTYLKNTFDNFHFFFENDSNDVDYEENEDSICKAIQFSCPTHTKEDEIKTELLQDSDVINDRIKRCLRTDADRVLTEMNKSDTEKEREPVIFTAFNNCGSYSYNEEEEEEGLDGQVTKYYGGVPHSETPDIYYSETFFHYLTCGDLKQDLIKQYLLSKYNEGAIIGIVSDAGIYVQHENMLRKNKQSIYDYLKEGFKKMQVPNYEIISSYNPSKPYEPNTVETMCDTLENALTNEKLCILDLNINLLQPPDNIFALWERILGASFISAIVPRFMLYIITEANITNKKYNSFDRLFSGIDIYNENISYITQFQKNENSFSSLLYSESQPPKLFKINDIHETAEQTKVSYKRNSASFMPWLNLVSIEGDVINYMEEIIMRVGKWRDTILEKKRVEREREQEQEQEDLPNLTYPLAGKVQ